MAAVLWLDHDSTRSKLKRKLDVSEDIKLGEISFTETPIENEDIHSFSKRIKADKFEINVSWESISQEMHVDIETSLKGLN